jgi:hypothetical protein
LIPERLKYALLFRVDYHQITAYKMPTDCEWWHAPLGSKSCHYVKSVQSWKDADGHVEGAIIDWIKYKD